MSIELFQMVAPAKLQAPAWLIEANQVLALSSVELQSLVQKELEENPALEGEERAACPSCGRAFQGACCPQCVALADSSLPQMPESAGLDDPGSWLAEGEKSGREDEAFDPTLLLAAKTSFAKQLRPALRGQLPAADTPLIDYLVGNLDEHGYLQCSVQEAAQICEVSLERAARVLAALQAQEPIGVGARNVRECLLIQLRYLEAQGVYHPYAYEITEHYLSQLAEQKHHQIARELKISLRHVKEAHAFIKSRLTPFPTAGYLGVEVNTANGLARPIQPDVVISRKAETTDGHAPDGHYEVDVVEAQRFCLHVSPSYAEAARSLAFQRRSGSVEQQQVQNALKRTKLFIANVRRRWQTLHLITSCLVEMQDEFLEHGVSALQPLTREQVAGAVGLHPSTVSRATAAKYVLLPNKQVIPFSTFFTANLSLKEALKNLIRQEQKPLSDQKLAVLLKKQGWEVARRTVAKYREELKILPASAR